MGSYPAMTFFFILKDMPLCAFTRANAAEMFNFE